MRINDAYLMKRTQMNLVISEETYIMGFLYVLCYLFKELKVLLEVENRFFGIVISYMNSIQQAYSTILPEINDDTEPIYQKILFLHKPVIIKEYRKLCKRGVTRADSMISVIHTILELLLSYESCPHQKEVKTLSKVITKLYDNIRNTGKKSKMKFLTITFKKYIDMGCIGNRCLNTFSIKDEELRHEKLKLEQPGIRLNEENEKISTTVWMEE